MCVVGVDGLGQTQGDVETAMSPSGAADAVSPNTRPLHQAMANPMAQPSSLPITPQTEDTRGLDDCVSAAPLTDQSRSWVVWAVAKRRVASLCIVTRCLQRRVAAILSAECTVTVPSI